MKTNALTDYGCLLLESYDLYKKEWCKARGYSLEDIDEEIGINGECYVCLEEFEFNEFQDPVCMNQILNDNQMSRWNHFVSPIEETKYPLINFDSLSDEIRDDYCVQVFENVSDLFDDLYVYEASYDVLLDAIRYLKQGDMHSNVISHMNVRWDGNKYYYANDMYGLEHEVLRHEALTFKPQMSLNDRIAKAKKQHIKKSVKEFGVSITETFNTTVYIEAVSLEEAKKTVSSNWSKGEYILDHEHFVGVEFAATPVKAKVKENEVKQDIGER